MPRLSVFGVFPNILLATIIIFSILKEKQSALLISFLAGLMLDVFSHLPFGIYTLNFVFICWLVQFVGNNFFRVRDFFGQIFLIFSASIAYSLLFFLSLKVFFWVGINPNIAFLANFSRIGLPEAGLNILASLLILIIFKKTHGLFARI